MSEQPINESAADVAARVMEVNRLRESTDATISKACEEVGMVFADDDARARAAAYIADGLPTGVTPEAARRLVLTALRGDPELAKFTRNPPAAGSFEAIRSAYAARRQPPKPVEPTAPTKPRTLEDVGAEIKARRSPLLYQTPPKPSE